MKLRSQTYGQEVQAELCGSQEHPLTRVLDLLPPVQSQQMAADALGIVRSTLDRYVKAGMIPPPFRFGRLRAYPTAEINQLRQLDLRSVEGREVAMERCKQFLGARTEMLKRCIEPLQAATSVRHEELLTCDMGVIRSFMALKEACRTAGSAPRWTEIPMTYSAAKARTGLLDYDGSSVARRGRRLRLSTAWIVVANICQQDWDAPGFIRSREF